MKKQFVALLLLFLCVGMVHAAEDLIERVENSARSWLELVDQERYSASWSASSSQLTQNKTELEWLESIKVVRTPLGAMVNRYIATAAQAKSLSGLPDGEYIVLQFYTTFAVKGLAMETITLAKQPDGAWLVADYEIK